MDSRGKFIAFLAVLALSACKKEENRTVKFFLENPNIRAQTLAKCDVIDGSMSNANCKNAREAELQSIATAARKNNLSDMNTLFGD